MAIQPNTLIYFCTVDFDNTYQHQRYFESEAQQIDYFLGTGTGTGCVNIAFEDYNYIRTTGADGSLHESVKVHYDYDSLRLMGSNYIVYVNSDKTDKYNYAFITKMVYINENTTEVFFETDVYQTWMFQTQIMDSYVVREHSATDDLFEHLVPEKFNFTDYMYKPMPHTDNLNDRGYLIGATNQIGEDDNPRGWTQSGIYQGLYFYYFDGKTAHNDINRFLTQIEEEHGDCVVFITAIPKFCISGSQIVDTTDEFFQSQLDGHLWGSYSAAYEDVYAYIKDSDFWEIFGFKPKNNKMYTAPFLQLIVTNHNGDEVEYAFEDFELELATNNREAFMCAHFGMHGDISANPSITLIPKNYKGLPINYDSGLSISNFPQCAFNSDTFKIWLAKNQFGIGINTIGNVGNMAMGVASAVTGNLAVGGAQIMHGVSGILNTMNSVHQASKEPNRVKGGGAKSNLLMSIGLNKFEFFYRFIKPEYAKTVDDYFTMYGYQTNRVKHPNLSARPCFNYVQTIDVNIIPVQLDQIGIPNDDMRKLKSVYNNGVTLWKSGTDRNGKKIVVGDYSLDNTI